MELTWTSFILEIINFLVLVWILRHFFYMPIQNVVQQRQHTIQATLDKAKQLHDESIQLQMKYENRLKDWEAEKEQKRKLFQQEMEAWKLKELAVFEKAKENEMEKILSREKQNLSSIIKKNSDDAVQMAGQFSAKFLSYFANDELEKQMINKIIEDLTHLSGDKLQLLKNAAQHNIEVTIQSAYPVSSQHKQQLTEVIEKIAGKKVIMNMVQTPDLLAGLNIMFGSVALQANLKDELKFFTEIEHV